MKDQMKDEIIGMFVMALMGAALGIMLGVSI